MNHNIIEFTAIIAVFGMPVLIVLIVMLFISRQKREKYHMVETMVKNGLPVPDSIFKPAAPREETPIQHLRNGLIYIAVGIGIAIALYMLGFSDAVGIASIPTLVGVAYIIVYLVTRGKTGNPTDTDSDPSL